MELFKAKPGPNVVDRTFSGVVNTVINRYQSNRFKRTVSHLHSLSEPTREKALTYARTHAKQPHSVAESIIGNSVAGAAALYSFHTAHKHLGNPNMSAARKTLTSVGLSSLLATGLGRMLNEVDHTLQVEVDSIKRHLLAPAAFTLLAFEIQLSNSDDPPAYEPHGHVPGTREYNLKTDRTTGTPSSDFKRN